MRFKLAFLLFCLLLCGCAKSDPVQEETVQESPRPKLSVSLPEPRQEGEFSETFLYFSGLLADRCYKRGETLYLSPQSLADFYGLEMTLELKEDSFHVSSPLLVLDGMVQQPWLQANGRYVYCPAGYLVENGSLYLPEDVIEKIFGVEVTIYGDPARAEISADSCQLLPGAADYYARNFGAEELYWLPRVIHAESKGQPMDGLIGVGNVVLNRLASPYFPDTVFQVIFDREYAVQFSPATTQGILDEPDERSIVAAYLCLEGYNTVGESMYFVNPDKANDQWFREALEFQCSIGQHDFYA